MPLTLWVVCVCVARTVSTTALSPTLSPPYGPTTSTRRQAPAAKGWTLPKEEERRQDWIGQDGQYSCSIGNGIKISNSKECTYVVCGRVVHQLRRTFDGAEILRVWWMGEDERRFGTDGGAGGLGPRQAETSGLPPRAVHGQRSMDGHSVALLRPPHSSPPFSTSHNPLPTHRFLPIAHCSLATANGSSLSVHCRLLSAQRSLLSSHSHSSLSRITCWPIEVCCRYHCTLGVPTNSPLACKGVPRIPPTTCAYAVHPVMSKPSQRVSILSHLQPSPTTLASLCAYTPHPGPLTQPRPTPPHPTPCQLHPPQPVPPYPAPHPPTHPSNPATRPPTLPHQGSA